MDGTVNCVFFVNDTATTEIYTLSLHDPLPIVHGRHSPPPPAARRRARVPAAARAAASAPGGRPGRCRRRSCRTRSEEHTSELQSRQYLVCRLLLDKKHRLAQATVTDRNRSTHH